MFVLKTFGGASVEGENGPLAGRVAHKRRLAVLALLAASPTGTLSRDRITGHLWPESANARARALLSESLYVLRKELDEDVFITIGDEITLNPQVITSDVADFTAAMAADDFQRAVALYRGPFLDGFSVADAAEFERWVEEERQHLALAYAKVLERLAEAAEAKGEVSQAVDHWRQLARHDPYSSPVALRLMQALARIGDRAAALRHASVHATLLNDDLGLEPGEDVLAFAMQLRHANPDVIETDSSDLTGSAAASSPEPRTGAELLVTPPYGPETALLDEVPADSAGRAAPQYPVQPKPKSRHWAKHAGPVLITLAMLGGLLFTAWGWRGQKPPAEIYDPSRVAVLYFDDHSPNQDLGYLASGLTENLIHRLSQVEALGVISRNGVKPYRRGGIAFDSIASALMVGTIVEGSVQRSGEEIRVTVQMVDARTGVHLQSRTVQRPMGELFTLEDEISDEVVRFLRARLGSEIRVRHLRSGTKNPEAWELVRRADHLREEIEVLRPFEKHTSAAAAYELGRQADSLLSRAERLDPRWVEPVISQGWLAMELAWVPPVTPASSGSALRRGLEHAERATALNPTSPHALELRGTLALELAINTSDVAESERFAAASQQDLRDAVASDPSLARAWDGLSRLQLRESRFAEANLLTQRALHADAYLTQAEQVVYRLFFTSMETGRFADAVHWCERGARDYPDEQYFIQCRLQLMALAGVGQPDPTEAYRLLKQLGGGSDEGRRQNESADMGMFRRLLVAAVLARAGATEEARSKLADERRKAERNPDLLSRFAFSAAHVYLLLDDHDSALQWLSVYLRERPHQRKFVAETLTFRPLQSDTRFQELVITR